MMKCRCLNNLNQKTTGVDVMDLRMTLSVFTLKGLQREWCHIIDFDSWIDSDNGNCQEWVIHRVSENGKYKLKMRSI